VARSSRTTLNQSCLTAAWQAQRQLTLSQGHPDTGFSLFITRAFHPLETTLLAARAQQPKVLPADFRSHGSFDEINVPVILHNAPVAPPVEYFRHNLDLARWMYPV